ncbi:hypothetical protein KKG41_06365 [Patescibacteria group bacterium]|nr:hypothetical protein [Patescibacteria group bacterium]MBU1890209.1 hypothetical protein [Patescibacteria group bacterium]
MTYIHAIKGSLLAFAIFVSVAILVPGHGPSDEVQLILTISTFLFAIIAGFFLTRLNTRYDRVRELVASEDALFLSFYRASIFFGTNFKQIIGKIIDKIYILSFDYDLGKYYKHNSQYIDSIYDELAKVKKLKNEKALNLFDDMVVMLTDLEDNRNKSTVITTERLTKGHWSVMLTLSAIIVFSIFYLKTEAIYSQVISILLSTVVVLVLLIIRDLQNFKHGGELLLSESGQEMFEAVGKLRYYNKRDLDSGVIKVPAHIKKYRLGLHKPGEKLNIKVVTNK